MPALDTNPFPLATDPDRHQIWEILVRHDFDCFVAADWSGMAPDFVDVGFYGIDAAKQSDPQHWTLKYPSVESYRADWMAGATAFQSVQLANGESMREFLYRAGKLTEIEINGDRALCRKKFNGSTTKADGSPINFLAQSLFVMARQGDTWKVAGFVGSLPYQP